MAQLYIDGMDTLQAFLKNVSPRVTDFLADSMVEVGDVVFAESQVQCPVDTGALKASGHVDPPDKNPGDITLMIGYGMDYALLVHENLSARHDPPTKAKFLEDPMLKALDELTSRMAGRLEAVIVGEYGAGASRPYANTAANVRGPDLRARRNGAYASTNIKSARSRLNNLRANPPARFKASRGQSTYWTGKGM